MSWDETVGESNSGGVKSCCWYCWDGAGEWHSVVLSLSVCEGVEGSLVSSLSSEGGKGELSCLRLHWGVEVVEMTLESGDDERESQDGWCCWKGE